MKAQEIERFKEKLAVFLADHVTTMRRSESRRYTEMYIRGLLMDGERKSIEPMAARIPDGDIQSLQQFVNQSPWSHQEARRSLARKVERQFVPETYWIIDEVSFPKKGAHSAGVAHQYCGALGKTANCQVAVTLDMGTEESSIPLDWALYPPESWIEDKQRRKKSGVPEDVVFETKTELAESVMLVEDFSKDERSSNVIDLTELLARSLKRKTDTAGKASPSAKPTAVPPLKEAGKSPVGTQVGPAGLVVLAGYAHILPDRLSQPGQRAAQLGAGLLDLPAQRAGGLPQLLINERSPCCNWALRPATSRAGQVSEGPADVSIK